MLVSARRCEAAEAVTSWGDAMTGFAPSLMSAWAAANPRPRLPPVTRKTLSRNPMSIGALSPTTLGC